MSQLSGDTSGLAGVAIILTATSTATVVSRFYQRRKLSEVRPDDWVMLCSLAIFNATNVLIFLGITNGSTLTALQGPAYDAAEANGRLIWYLKEVLYAIGLSLARVSICIFFGYVTDLKAHVYVLWLALTGSVVAGICTLFVLGLQCLPVSYFWNQAIHEGSGTCMPAKTIIDLGYLYSVACAAIDLGLCLLPVDIVRRTTLERREKILFFLMLGVASIGGIAPMVRIAYMTGLANIDYLHATVPGFCLWSAVEYGVTITAASFAAMQPLDWELDNHRRMPSEVYHPPPVVVTPPNARRLTEITVTTAKTQSTLTSLATTKNCSNSEKSFF